MIVKVCACGRAYDAAAWLSLPYGGRQDDGDGGWLILRHCACASTLAVEEVQEISFRGAQPASAA